MTSHDDHTGPVPPGNRPGHHGSVEQDKPDLDAFAARLGIQPDGTGSADTDPAAEPPVGDLGQRLPLAHAETDELGWGDVAARSQQLVRTSIGLGCDVALLSVRTAGRLVTLPLRR